MPRDRFADDGDLLDPLAAELLAFGDTLSHLTDEPIRPVARGPADAGPVPLTMEVGRSNRAVWLMVAAVLLVAAGFGLGRLWPAGDGSIDSTGSPDAEADRSDEPGVGEQQGQPAVEQDQATTETTVAVAPATPSTITAADGTVLAVVDDPGALALGPTPVLDHSGEVVSRAVLIDLIRARVFGSASREEVADLLAAGGLTITTTFDLSAVDRAQATIAELHPAGDRPDEVALVTVDNRTGALVAVASSGQPTSVLIDGLRQPGSAFKPIVLATLFEQGQHPDDLVNADGPCRFALPDEQGGDIYTVGGGEQGVRSLRSVTLSSNNCAFVRLGQAAGLDEVVATARDLGLSTLPDGAAEFLSLPLGVTEVNGVELAGAYATLANGGVHRSPWLVAEVVDRDGEVLYRRGQDADETTSVLTAETAALVTSVLEDNVAAGTGTRARLSGGHPAAGKTGTTEDMVDAWFVGSTARYTTVVWVGDPTEARSPIRIPGWSSFGGGLPAAVWGRYNDELHRGLDPELFPEPPTLDDRDPVMLEAEQEVTGG